MSLGDLIKAYRTEHNMTMQEFAEECGLSKGYISMLEKNVHPQNNKPIIPSIETYNSVATAMGLTLNDVLSSIGKDQLVDISRKSQASESIRIKVYGSVPAGVPTEAIQDIVGWEDIPKTWAKHGSEYIGLKVKGDSMFPKYIEDDTIIIRLQPDCESGQDAVVYVNGYDATLKKVVKKNDGVILQPLNPKYDPKVYENSDKDAPIIILGVVVEIRRRV